MSVEYFLIGCGLFNCTLARLFAEAGHKVHIIEARDHIGGNCFDLVDEKTGYRYHKYGPHIFHFSDNKWFEFLSRFGTLRPFHHSVKSVFGDAKFQIPVNLDTINQFFNVNLKPSEVAAFLESRALKIDKPKIWKINCWRRSEENSTKHFSKTIHKSNGENHRLNSRALQFREFLFE